ncbi:hypothetical protein HBI56_007530 [Parastagonospora nodorum]|uniref:Uncharacterized protein n=1 Tax=Phaeosphaeria nodorum (strain SN15 / ATCC MYA-4574 / FGSC 10173) TaxID=321614 RepID=A0A7U2EQ81_PHANO|nr:hypothetical protein HBH56_122190 [Parastagonospora nodorum]QRC91029.1 hypothetical protein JI435_426400 [Parastagonospora nodorum SN15]KAH3934864.1 hypothetical protein HBH54_047740 [Parastagonospora nodorum]KAH3950138.1 hypothetical protein HBH53_076220 [Parastagonospora nodorum]KAH3987158.1 hypothetical protein HBH51_009310 [Parastagonospora nodorum]
MRITVTNPPPPNNTTTTTKTATKMPPRSFMLATEIHEVDLIQTKVELDMELHGGPAQQADEWRALLALHLFCRAVRGVLRGLYRQALADEWGGEEKEEEKEEEAEGEQEGRAVAREDIFSLNFL